MKSDARQDQFRRYVRTWEANGPLLEDIRDQETRRADTAGSIQALAQAFQIALRDLPPRASSGLVEWQEFMTRWQSRG